MCDVSQVDAEKPYFKAMATASIAESVDLKLTHSQPVSVETTAASIHSQKTWLIQAMTIFFKP